MHTSMVLSLILAATVYTTAQASCPPTVTVTSYPATLSGPETSSHTRQIVYTTEFHTTVVTSNGESNVETMAKVPIAEMLLKERQWSSTEPPSCPEAITITVMENPTPFQTLGTPPATSSTLLSWNNSNLTIGGLNSTSVGVTFSSAASTDTTTSSASRANSTNSSGTSNTTWLLQSPPQSAFSVSSSTTALHSISPSSTLLPDSGLSPAASALTSSASDQASSSSTTTEQSTSSGGTALSSYGVALDVWSTPTPTLDCVFPCQLKMPCMSLPTPTTITFPGYTTTLCKPGCDGSVQMKSKTVIILPALTTDSVCFYPITATGEGPITPVPRWITDTRTIDAPTGLSTCPPVFAKPDNDGRCGPRNHYMCEKKKCCGKLGTCGSGKDFCEAGCQPNYGNCWKNSTSCEVPVFADTDETTPIPIFPVFYSDDDNSDVILPPIVITKGIDLPGPICKDTCDDPICRVLGCDGKCGFLGCSGIDMGWVKFKFPKIDCHSVVRKATCLLFKTGCCPSKDNGGGDDDDDGGCTIPQCTKDNDDDTGINGDTEFCNPETDDECGNTPEESKTSSSSECSSTTTVHDQTAHCMMMTASNGITSTSCTSTATGSPREGCSIQPSTITSFTSACQTQTASHVTNQCTFLTGSGNDTRTECTSIATTFSGCDVTGMTTTSATTECSNSNTVTNITSSCFATNITSMGSTFPGSGTCTGATSTVFSGCDLSGTVTSVTSFAENVCEHVPSDMTIIPMTPGVAFGEATTTTAAGTIDARGISVRGDAHDGVQNAAASTDAVLTRWWNYFVI